VLGAGRVAVIPAAHQYHGLGQMVGIDLGPVDSMQHRYGSTSGTYDDLDRFDRVTSSRWTKDLSTDRDFYDVDITYDRNSNITRTIDNVHTDGSSNHFFDVSYTIDDRNRLTNAQEGHWNGSSISTEEREQTWTLTTTGNWSNVQVDLNGDGTLTGTNERDEDRTHNLANEITQRDPDGNPGTSNVAPAYDGAGNLVDDDEDYEYVYDAWGRLRKLKNTVTGGSPLVAEYNYDGHGQRIGWPPGTSEQLPRACEWHWIRQLFVAGSRRISVQYAIDSAPRPVESGRALGDGPNCSEVPLANPRRTAGSTDVTNTLSRRMMPSTNGTPEQSSRTGTF